MNKISVKSILGVFGKIGIATEKELNLVADKLMVPVFIAEDIALSKNFMQRETATMVFCIHNKVMYYTKLEESDSTESPEIEVVENDEPAILEAVTKQAEAAPVTETKI